MIVGIMSLCSISFWYQLNQVVMKKGHKMVLIVVFCHAFCCEANVLMVDWLTNHSPSVLYCYDDVGWVM